LYRLPVASRDSPAANREIRIYAEWGQPLKIGSAKARITNPCHIKMRTTLVVDAPKQGTDVSFEIGAAGGAVVLLFRIHRSNHQGVAHAVDFVCCGAAENRCPNQRQTA